MMMDGYGYGNDDRYHGGDEGGGKGDVFRFFVSSLCHVGLGYFGYLVSLKC